MDVLIGSVRPLIFDLCAARASVYFSHLYPLTLLSLVQVLLSITATVEVKFDSETVQYPHGRFSLHASSVVI